ncbi:MAG: hypothetical protein K8T91_26215 [Planctomycetes bacterium]|nr:hypothetical protein [Planctomycetota bacterium]
MAKKNANGRKPSGIARIATIEASPDLDASDEGVEHLMPEEASAPSKRQRKAKAEPVTSENYSVADIRKAATFVKSVGSLDKAIAVLQILKVAKEAL